MDTVPSKKLAWRKASYSTPSGCCVEVAPLPEGGVAVRDSKNPDGLVLSLTRQDWAEFADWTARGGAETLTA